MKTRTALARRVPEIPAPRTDLARWDPEDPTCWNAGGRTVAWRNLWISTYCLLLAFAVWVIFSVVTVHLDQIGFRFDKSQLFLLTAVAGLSGATFRLVYSFVVPIFGGRNWTVIATALLLVPAVGVGIAVQNPNTSFATFLLLSASCGFGGGAFSSSMANISFFFPKREQGTALGLNGGLGNLGVSTLQFLAPMVITAGVFGALGGEPRITPDGREMWLQNAAFVWVPLIVLGVVAAAFGMNNLKSSATPLSEQLVIFRRKHMYLTTWLYIMSFGSFIGYSAAFPLLIKDQFPEVNPLAYAFIGPLLGALIRPVGGWISDRLDSGARVTLVTLFVMIGAVLGVIWFLTPEHRSFQGFFALFMVLFITTGVANGSVFRMMGVIFPPREKAPALGFSAAIAAYGAFILPMVFSGSIRLTTVTDASGAVVSPGSALPALWGFIAYYVTCIGVTWWWYARKNAEKPS
ncbi:NarK family nitrate/nitrite MFS transporter [Phaeovibrio sulfidiphilus]|uniref:Nitrate/nitrite transporter n=1 Tax=Phaeovibrio sulfidiphilus TaxID=1220600 RepID=A0A8J7CPS4_9PROT|nr:NarK family nitrate/nitrite MFS transporter [Phaeovibrio sulfidiphilus]MBE1237382.1 NarK family nitrate/nitrite MFS transporter [Phaeovibrio sulfidiphilus]